MSKCVKCGKVLDIIEAGDPFYRCSFKCCIFCATCSRTSKEGDLYCRKRFEELLYNPKKTFIFSPKNSAIKHDEGKLPFDLLPVEALTEITKALQHGANKYSAHNWRAGMKWSRLYAAILRHLFAWASGEKNDPESGLSHLAHVGCCLFFLLTYEVQEAGEDDLFYGTLTNKQEIDDGSSREEDQRGGSVGDDCQSGSNDCRQKDNSGSDNPHQRF